MNRRLQPLAWVFASLFLGFLLASMIVYSAAAHSLSQSAGSDFAALSTLDLDEFPRISGQLRAYRADGSFVDSLDASQVTILEGSRQLSVDELNLRRPGVQFAMAVLGGSDLVFKDSEGFSSLDYLLQGIDGAVSERGDGSFDDLSLIVQGSTELLHLQNAGEWLDAVKGINQDSLRQSTPDLQMISRALAVAAAAPPTPGMSKALLIITPPVRNAGVTGLQSLASTARQEGVRVYVWLVSSQEYASSILSNGLRLLAAETGGAFFNYSGVETIPDVQNYLEPLRQIYDFSYTSAVRSSGVFTIAASIQSDSFSQRTAPLEFAMSIAAPNPIFVGLPFEITRNFIEGSPDPASTSTPVRFEPDSQIIRILVEFPDGINRSLRETILLVNGAPVAVNASEPFNEFTWDLSSYTESGLVMVKAEAIDSLGLSGSSAEFPVTITVIGPPPPPPSAIMMTPQGALALLLAAIALGAVVGLILLVSGRLSLVRKPAVSQSRPVRRAVNGAPPTATPGQPGGKASTGPITKPLARERSPSSGLPGWMGRVQRRMQPARSDVQVAYLTPISEDEEGAAPPLPINADETILGSETTWTTWAIKDPSLAPVHARMRREGTSYRLFDEKTIGGTWVNYTAVPPEGILLAHGDAIHFGRVGFRFTLRGAVPNKPVITQLRTRYPF